MTCPRCQGLIVREYEEERCLNCGHRTSFVPPPTARYRPLPVIAPSPTAQTPASGLDAKRERQRTYYREWVRKRKETEARQEKRRDYMRRYMREYNQRSGVREKAYAAHRAWQRRRAASSGASPC